MSEEFRIKEYERESKIIYMKRFSQSIADEFLLHYKYLGTNEGGFQSIVNCSMDRINLTEDEKRSVIENSKQILQEQYDLEIISDNPLVIKSKNR